MKPPGERTILRSSMRRGTSRAERSTYISEILISDLIFFSKKEGKSRGYSLKRDFESNRRTGWGTSWGERSSLWRTGLIERVLPLWR